MGDDQDNKLHKFKTIPSCFFFLFWLKRKLIRSSWYFLWFTSDYIHTIYSYTNSPNTRSLTHNIVSYIIFLSMCYFFYIIINQFRVVYIYTFSFICMKRSFWTKTRFYICPSTFTLSPIKLFQEELEFHKIVIYGHT